MAAHTYPVTVDARLEEGLSRWLWLVKWLLAIPHYLVLGLLWVAFAILSVIAFVAILVTGHYPRSIFEFNVGVLRWTWRVAYYTYGCLGTDQYPPFSLQDHPAYPARLDVEYPEHLSRGLVLVKWWLLAIPHYILVGILLGTGWYVVTEDGVVVHEASVGLIALLVLVAAVVLLFTGGYPRAIFDLVLGLNRWVLRVAAYVGLMTDVYPPFRLDMGGTDPGTAILAPLPAPGAPPGTLPTPPAEPRGRPGDQQTGWSAGRVGGAVTGSVLALVACGLLTGGAAVGLADRAFRDESGFLMSPASLASPGYAIHSERVELEEPLVATGLPQRWLGTVQVAAETPGGQEVFLGIAQADDLNAYLRGVAHSVVLDPAGDDDRAPELVFSEGGPPTTDPATAGIWVASASGPGRQALTWSAEPGDWALVVMNRNGAAPVRASVVIGATVPILGEAALAMLIAGLVLLLVAAAVLFASIPRSSGHSGQRVGAAPHHA